MAQNVRTAGLLLHPTSLPGGHGIGDLGDSARSLLRWMQSAGLSEWQVLPLGPADAGGSPYTSCAAMGGNLLLIDLAGLVEVDLLTATDLAPSSTVPLPPSGRAVDFAAVAAFKLPRIYRAAERLVATREHPWHAEFTRFCRDEAGWLDDVAAFLALGQRHDGAAWPLWPPGERDRAPAAMAAVRASADWSRHAAVQFLFEQQWRALRRDAAAAGVAIIGDAPIYVAHDSADVWAHRALFDLDRAGAPCAVAGVPPDAYAALGQLWGNPLYDWPAHQREGFAWWKRRVARLASLCDVVRIDHFRGLLAYWSVPADAVDASGGQWCDGPGDALLTAICATPGLSIVAEDLGTIDDDVRALRDRHGLPGMAVLQFAWDGDPTNAYLPHQHSARLAVYTGTHDNDTTVGWWRSMPEVIRHRVRVYLGVDGRDIEWDFIRVALASVAERAVVPVQDVLGLGSEARMNLPGQARGNWAFRLLPGELQGAHADRLRALNGCFGRLPGAA